MVDKIKTSVGKWIAILAVLGSAQFAYNSIDEDTVDFAINTPYHVNALYLTDGDSTPILQGPATARVGELVRIHSGADSVKWRVVPETDSQEFGTGSLAVSFPDPGEYTVIAAASRGGNISLEMHTIVVGGAPDIPAPIPAPDNPVSSTLASQVTQWCVEENVPKELATKVGENFKKVAESQTITSMDELVKETASLNKLVPAGNHTKVLAKLQVKLLADPRPQSLDEYRSLWKEIAAGWLAHSGV